MKPRSKTHRAAQAADVVNPRAPLDGFDVPQVIRELESSITDAGPFYARLERNERTRQCLWANKDPSGRKVDTPKRKAKPWNYAADHEVHLAQEVLLQLTAQRAAAMQRGALSVTPMEGTDARAAGQMKLVMRYYLETAMRTERLVQGTRWASWALRYGHAVLYVGWKTVKAMERRTFRLSAVIEHVLRQRVAELSAQGVEIDPVQGEDIQQSVTLQVLEATDEQVAAWLLELFPELRARGKEAAAEALRAARTLRRDTVSEDPESHFYAAFVKEDRPTWEALRQGVDFFCPPETVHEDGFDSARWLARVRWLSEAQIREEAALRDWDPAWVAKVLATTKGKSRMFSSRTSRTPWALSGLGVGWGSQEGRMLEAGRHLYQLVEYYDRKVTADGVQCLYKTVLHPDVPDLVAERELLEDWHGHYPFVPATNEQDEPLLLANRGVPELVASPQNAIKTQWDARDDAASLSTLPPFTGPEMMGDIVVAPGAFIPEWRTGAVQPWKLPPPDSRSVEIETTLRASVDRYFGLMSRAVPEPLAMLLGQTGVDWFLAAYSRAVALTAQLVQQRMSRLTGARITGTELVFSATREEVRGAFDFSTKFDVRSLDIEWTKNILNFVQGTILPMDNRALVNRRAFIELGLNMIDPALVDAGLRTDEAAAEGEAGEEAQALSSIFSGGVPAFTLGADHATRAQVMQQDLQQSPVRQQMLAGNPMIRAVWEDRLQKHLFQLEQEQNRVAGIEGGSDPLRQSPLARLKAGGWEAMLAN